MSKPNLIRHGYVEVPNVQPYKRYLPNAFDDSLSLIEKINLVIESLNKIGVITNEMLDKWNEVYSWVMNEGLDESTRKRLNEMIKNGDFDTIINEELLNSKTTIVTSKQEPVKPDKSYYWYEVKDTSSPPTDHNHNVYVGVDEPEHENVWYKIMGVLQ